MRRGVVIDGDGETVGAWGKFRPRRGEAQNTPASRGEARKKGGGEVSRGRR